MAALGLFVVWGNSFIAIGYLLGSEEVPARLDWVGLTVARYLPAGFFCGGYCLAFQRRESLALLRAEWPRLVAGGFCAVPVYNFALNLAQQQGVPAPVASLTTALVPLFVMLLAAVFLGEALTRRRVTGFLVALAGMAVIAATKAPETGGTYPLWILVAALSPLSFAVFSVLSKPLAGRVSPLLWSYLAVALGSLWLVPLLPLRWQEIRALDAPGWAALLYLVLPCTVFGFVVWTWLLRHLPASTVGLTVFLNPPMTTVSKAVLAVLFPATFVFTIQAGEWLGGALALAGLGVAVTRRGPLGRWRVG